MPKFLAGSRPVMRLVGFGGEFQGFPIHPGDHQHRAATGFLRHYLHQSVLGPVYLVEPIFGHEYAWGRVIEFHSTTTAVLQYRALPYALWPGVWCTLHSEKYSPLI